MLMDRPRLLLVASLLFASCGGPNAVLLTVSADAPVEQYDLYVRDDATSQIVFHSGFNAVQLPSEKMRDLTKESLKVSIKVGSGHYTLLLVGVIGDVVNGGPAVGATQLFWAGRVHVDGTIKVSAQLITVPAGEDADGDLWPDATSFRANNAEAAKLYQDHPDLLDCFDDPNQMPLDGNGNPIKFTAAEINPFAVEVCGDGFDENCNGNADETCVDKDKDHDPSTTDCDDNDPERHHATDIDPFPDPPNCCGYSLGKSGSDANTSFLCGTGASPPPCYAASCNCTMLLCPKQRCGDGIDESCQGKDTTCVVDDDCDGYPAPPQGNDCDDHDPNVHPGALEPCGSTKDLNCDGVINGGCIPCDLDGDGFERNDAVNGCPDAKDKNPGKTDCNDYDSSVFPGATASCGGTEAGMTSIGRLTCSLRQACRTVYEVTGPAASATPKVSSLGWLVGDADCNGTAYEGCPPVNCDADGDGWPVNDGVCAAVDGKFDCDDTNPTIYPGAPVSCGTGPAEDCSSSQRLPCTQDADGDGWNMGADCNDNDPTIHPWAVELCDGKDNDCDGFVDEGNPDVMGKPLVASGAVTSCTDSNVGECAKTLGACVCSVALPMSTINAANRTACPTEIGVAPKPPHCFGAGQPHPQSCDSTNPRDDDCNGANDDKAGANLAVLGMPCGIMGPGPVSICRPGLVIGCDSSQTNCFEAFGLVPKAQSWYVCSSQAVCPQTEQCNGFDDDCNGSPKAPTASPDPDENDVDADGYLACVGCAGLMWAPGILGCGDCDDTRSDTHPGAPEKCDSRNNSCDPAWGLSPGGTDGKDECMGATPNCCSDENTCRNTTAGDPNHCGGCVAANICTPLRANQCANGGCVCGNGMSAALCATSMTGNGTDSYWCNSGVCNACIDNVHCGPGCVDCTMSSAICRTDKTACTGCNVDGDCSSKTAGTYCNTGACQACTVNTHCGNPACTDCTAQSTNKVCVSAGSKCGCSVASTDCNNGEYCNGSAACASCTIATHCWTGTGTSCTDCTASAAGHLCKNSGQAQPCGCNADTDCASGAPYCHAGACVVKRPNGDACGGSGECSTGNCVGSICCNSACTPTCPTTTSQQVYSCSTGTCTASGGATGCGTGYSCTAGTGCNNRCNCGSNCSDAACSSTYYCVSNACTFCSAQTFCATTNSCMTCVGNVNGKQCTNAGMAQPCGCATSGNGGDCGATQFCSSGTCATCDNSTTHCKTVAGCIDCTGVGTGSACQFPSTATPCGCASDANCGATQYCDTSVSHTCKSCGLGALCAGNCNTKCGSTNYCNGVTCVACNTQTECSNGSSCVTCVGNSSGTACQAPGTATPCGCASDSDCPSGNWCNGSNQCQACGTGATCGGAHNCQNLTCGSGNWCFSGTCSSCSAVASKGGPCDVGQACAGQCGGASTLYCNPGTKTCRRCSNDGDDQNCGSCGNDCTTGKQYCDDSNVCASPSPAPRPCPGHCAKGNGAAGDGTDCDQCINGTTLEFCGAGPNCP